MRKLRGQINFEFLAAAALYLIALGAIVTSGSNFLPQYEGQADRASLNLEARSLTNTIITEKGSHSFGSGGNNWEKNSSTAKNIESFGLANGFLDLNRSKIESLTTTGNASGGTVNYTVFKQVTDVEKQYRFRFTWLPTIDTNRTYTKFSPPSNPNIQEPTTSSYQEADNTVHYGQAELRGIDFYFLVTAHDGVYDTAYFTTEPGDWDFSNADPLKKGDRFSTFNYRIKEFQNRVNDKGALLILSKPIKTFGASLDSDTTTIRMSRFAEMENEPIRMEVWTW